jgi:hypothetical protein
MSQFPWLPDFSCKTLKKKENLKFYIFGFCRFFFILLQHKVPKSLNKVHCGHFNKKSVPDFFLTPGREQNRYKWRGKRQRSRAQVYSHNTGIQIRK